VSATVFINGRNAAVQSSTGSHGSIIVGGSGSVIIGDTVTAAPVSAVSAMPNLAAATAALVPAAAPQAAALAGAPAVAALAPTIPVVVADPRAAAAKILDDFQAAPMKERIFNDQAHPMGTPQDPFEKSKIHEQIEARLAKAQGGSLKRFHPISPYPDQKDTSLCGPATFFYALLMDRPDLYAKAITELWETGETTIGQLHIKPSHGACNPKNFSRGTEGDRIWAIDWITLACLRDSENLLFAYDEPDDMFSGITLPAGLGKWFKQAGAEILFDNIQFSSHINQDQLSELFQYIRPGTHMATLIGAGMLAANAGQMKNHWVTWEQPAKTLSGPITSTTAPSDTISSSMIFSWGELLHQIPAGSTLQTILKYIYGGLVFSKIP